MEIKKKLIEIMNQIGLQCEYSEEDIDLREYIEDSFMFINFVIAIEDTFELELPEEMLNIENVASIDGLSNLIQQCIDSN